MKKLLLAILTIPLLFSLGQASNTATLPLIWDPPLYYSGDTCEENGPALTPEDISQVLYFVSYREVGTTDWLQVDLPTNTTTITGLKYSTTYEVTVATHWQDKPPQCVSNGTFTTPAAPPPGACGNLRLNE